jgi:hypothetical protein
MHVADDQVHVNMKQRALRFINGPRNNNMCGKGSQDRNEQLSGIGVVFNDEDRAAGERRIA